MTLSTQETVQFNGSALSDKHAGIMLVHSTLQLAQFGCFGENLDALWDRMRELLAQLESQNKTLTVVITDSSLVHPGVLDVLSDAVEESSHFVLNLL